MMECEICGHAKCNPMWHTDAERERYAPAIAAFERARAIRAGIRDAIIWEMERDGIDEDRHLTQREIVRRLQMQGEENGA